MIISNDRGVGRIVSAKGGGAFRPTAIGLDALLLNRFCSHEARFFRQEVRRQRTQRSDVVDNPDTAAVRGEHEIVRAGLDGEIAHGHGWEAAAFELGPRLTTVD